MNLYKTLGIIAAIIIVAVAGYFLLFRNQAPQEQTATNQNQGQANLNGDQQNPPASGGSPEQGSTAPKNNMHLVTIQTNMGTIQFETYDADAPKAVENFITLANKGFYNGVIFHRVINGFMIQGGDPQGTGMGGPGYTFVDELNPNTESYKQGYKRGVVAMANAGPNTNGSQFFIMHQDYPLPNNYTIFGKVVKGQEVVDAIAKVATNPADRPLQAVVMTKVTVEKK